MHRHVYGSLHGLVEPGVANVRPAVTARAQWHVTTLLAAEKQRASGTKTEVRLDDLSQAHHDVEHIILCATRTDWMESWLIFASCFILFKDHPHSNGRECSVECRRVYVRVFQFPVCASESVCVQNMNNALLGGVLRCYTMKAVYM